MLASMSIRDPRRAAKTTLKVVVLLSAVITIVFLVSFFFSKQGISQLQESRIRVEQLEAEISRLEAENARLQKEIESLNSSTFAVERVARESLGLSKPGEIVYMLPPADPQTQN
jgi:cell division protein FtsB